MLFTGNNFYGTFQIIKQDLVTFNIKFIFQNMIENKCLNEFEKPEIHFKCAKKRKPAVFLYPGA